MNKEFKTVILILTSILSITLGIVIFNIDIGELTFFTKKGNDTYTILQHGIYSISKILRLGLGSILLVGGLVIGVCGLSSDSKKEIICNENQDTSIDQDREVFYDAEKDMYIVKEK